MSHTLGNILAIINPHAGRSGATKPAKLLCEELRRSGANVQETFTTGIGDACDIAFNEGALYDLVVACGGDGTLSEVVSGLMRLESPPDVGFLPIGSTCDVAQTYKLSYNPVKAAHDMLHGSSFAIDIGQVSGSTSIMRDDLPDGVVPGDADKLPNHFTYVSSFGAFAETSYATRRELKKALGHFAYVVTGIWSVKDVRPVKTNVILDGVDYSGEYIFGGVLNSFSVGGMVRLDNVIFDDGVFEVLLVKPPKNVGQIAKLVSLLLRRKTGDAIIRKRARQAVFTFDKPISFTVDGEYGGSRTMWQITNIPRAINLRIPKPPQTHSE
ncbi:MAG: YegS/Rv2252/BmrU family lipid kinase [Clostridiaceae bacterium]|jgi:YegS/Rv2252/BmrU family lipid kinase|nr:YegS/Rv2252/BmrU family lipid kinase [Clostridiaceae bacterium]